MEAKLCFIGRGGMSGPADCEVIGRWQIVAADLWDRDYLDLTGPAYFQIGAEGWAEFAFGAVDATAELEYGRRIVFFRWSGFDEGDQIAGSGTAELQDDGSLEIELSFDEGDDAILTAHRGDFFNSLLSALPAAVVVMARRREGYLPNRPGPGLLPDPGPFHLVSANRPVRAVGLGAVGASIRRPWFAIARFRPPFAEFGLRQLGMSFGRFSIGLTCLFGVFAGTRIHLCRMPQFVSTFVSVHNQLPFVRSERFDSATVHKTLVSG